ncbi:MAG TPA: lamin tail domain-containing protein [Verrucomicrobiales bacterium]|nr:lamin tail domain-containing protein [Verrucomicrobiales bacterium]
MHKSLSPIPSVAGRLAVLALALAAIACVTPSRAGVVINEIYYDAEPNTSASEFIELYNSGPGAADLTGWHFSRGIEYTFPAGATLAAGQYLVLVESTAGYNQRFGPVPPVAAFGQYAGGLSNDGEVIVLTNAAGTEVDRVGYESVFPWPIGANGGGVSMELINASLDNDLAGSWRSATTAPTPGAQNSVFAANAPPQMRQVDHAPKQPASTEQATITVKVTDPDGVASVQLQYQLVTPGNYFSAFLAKPIATLLASPNTPLPANPAYDQNWISVAMVDDGTGGDLLAGDSIYTARIPAQANRTLVRYRITATDVPGASIRVPYADDPSKNFAYFVYNGVPDFIANTRSVTGTVPYTHKKEVLTALPVYTLLTTQTDYDRCVAYDGASQIPANNYDARSAENWPGTFVYNGKVHDNIRYRLRQRNARYAGGGKRSFHFSFNNGSLVQFHDQSGREYPTKWKALNTHRMVSSRGEANFGLYEAANSVLWNTTGTAAPFTHWIHLRVVKGAEEQPAGTNGQHLGDFWGLMLALEDYDVRFLEAHNLEEGNLYKLKTGGNDGLSIQRFQAQTAVSNASDFTTIINQLRSTQTDQWLRDHVDWNSWYHYHAIEDAIRHYDVSNGITTNNGEHLKNQAYYFKPATGLPLGRLQVLPWDSDTSWGPNWNGGWDWPKSAISTAAKVEFNKEYKNVVREIRDLVWREDQLFPLLDYYQALLEPFTLADRDRWTSATGTPNPGAQTDGPIATRVAVMKQFAFTGGSWTGGTDGQQDWVFDAAGNLVANNTISMDTGISGQQGRDAYLDALSFDPKVPARPTVTYAGAANYPVNGIALQSSAFSDPDGAGTFAAMEYRVAEITPYVIPVPPPANTVILPGGSVWKYEVSAAGRGNSDIVFGHPSYNSTNWKHPDFTDTAWPSGAGMLGYGDADGILPVTTLTFGADPNNKITTYYFRRKVTVTDKSPFESFLVNVVRDDGAIVYVNGRDIGRTQMPEGVVTPATFANVTSSAADERTFYPLPVPASIVVQGENTITVEVHQVNLNSSDLSFDLRFEGVPPNPNPPPTPPSSPPQFEWKTDWESGELTAFTGTIAVPASAVRGGSTYRARVRHKDTTGRWSSWSAPLEFVASLPNITPLTNSLVVSEVMYDPAPATAAESALGYVTSDFEWVELFNAGAATLDLTDVRFTKGVDFNVPAGTTMAAGEYAVVVRNSSAFTARYGAGPRILGQYTPDNLNNDGEQLKLSYGAGEPIRDFIYDDAAPWPAGAKETGASIYLLSAGIVPDHTVGENWRASTTAGGTPGRSEPPGDYGLWSGGYFSAGEPGYPQIAAPGFDADGDGFANATEYALGTNPRSPVSLPGFAATAVVLGGQQYLSVSYTRIKAVNDVALVGQASSDLAAWNVSDVVEVSRTDNGNGTETVVIRHNVPFSAAGGSRRFLRLAAVVSP